MRKIWLTLLLLVACGDPISGAGNCTELLTATRSAAAGLPDGTFAGLTGEERAAAINDFYEQWDALRLQVEPKAEEMIAAAIERGADTEAILCQQAIDVSYGPVPKVFETVATAAP